MSSSSAKSGIFDISKHLAECGAGGWGGTDWWLGFHWEKDIEEFIIKHLGEKPGDFSKIGVTTHSNFDKKDKNFGCGSSVDLLITLPIRW